MPQIFVKVPFALSGGKLAIPEAVQPGGEVSFTEGYGPRYSQDPTTTGLRLDREQSNELFYILSTGINQYQTESFPRFITTADNGGVPYSYSKYATVLYDDGGGLAPYQSLVNTNTTLPTVTANWRKLDPYNRLIERDSPAFTGTPTAPTPAGGDNSTKLATTAFVTAAIAAAVSALGPQIKAKIVFDGTGALPVILSQYNVASITPLGNNAGAGPRRYQLAFSTALPDNDYSVIGGNTAKSGGTNCAIYATPDAGASPVDKTTTTVTVIFGTGNGDGIIPGEGSIIII